MLTIRPKVAELAFQLYGRSLHPELFQVHKSRCIERGGYEATVDITNAGHVVSWRYEGLTLAEVASSAQHPLPKRRCLLSCQLKGEHTERVECRGGIIYRCKLELETVTPEFFWNFQEQLSGDGEHEGLLHRFDSSGRIALGALSYIHVETRSRSMRVKAFHTFPDDCAIVKSQSSFELPRS